MSACCTRRSSRPGRFANSGSLKTVALIGRPTPASPLFSIASPASARRCQLPGVTSSSAWPHVRRGPRRPHPHRSARIYSLTHTLKTLAVAVDCCAQNAHPQARRRPAVLTRSILPASSCSPRRCLPRLPTLVLLNMSDLMETRAATLNPQAGPRARPPVASSRTHTV